MANEKKILNARISKYGKITDGAFFSKYIVSFYKKVRSPPYCCSVLLDPRLVFYILQSVQYHSRVLSSSSLFLSPSTSTSNHISVKTYKDGRI